MKTIVIDMNTIIAAGWRVNAHARRVLAGVARRLFGWEWNAEKEVGGRAQPRLFVAK